MAKKIETLKKIEEIKRKFPGEFKREATKTGSLRSYLPTPEQEAWMVKYVGKKYSFSCFSDATGISIPSAYRILAKHNEKYAKLNKKAIESKVKSRKNKKAEKLAEAKKKPEKKWAWDIEQEKLKKKMLAKAKLEELERQKAEEEEDRLNHLCYVKRKGRMRARKPIPFTEEEKKLRADAFDKYYILPDGDELLTDRRRCIYWDNDTKRTPRIEEEADRLKFNVIEYRKMFPDKSNHFSSCKGGQERFSMY